MSTFGELKVAVSKRVIDPSNTAISASDVGDAINSAVAFYAKKDPWFVEGSGTVTLTVNSPTITGIPSDFEFENQSSGIVISYNDAKYPLAKITPEAFDNMDTGSQGIPTFYTYRADVYSCYPYPDYAYTATTYYKKKFTALSNADDINDFTTEEPNLIIYDALARLYAEFRQDFETAKEFEEKRDKEWLNLLALTNKKRATGSLMIDE